MKNRVGFVSNSSSSSFIIFSSLTKDELMTIVKKHIVEEASYVEVENKDFIDFKKLKISNDDFDPVSEVLYDAKTAFEFSISSCIQPHNYYVNLHKWFNTTSFALSEDVLESIREYNDMYKNHRDDNNAQIRICNNMYAAINKHKTKLVKDLKKKFITVYEITASDEGGEGELEHDILPKIWKKIEKELEKTDKQAELFIVSHH